MNKKNFYLFYKDIKNMNLKFNIKYKNIFKLSIININKR